MSRLSILLDETPDVYTIGGVPKKKITQRNWRPTMQDVKIIAELQRKLGVSEADILRLGIRCLAEKESIGSLQRAG